MSELLRHAHNQVCTLRAFRVSILSHPEQQQQQKFHIKEVNYVLVACCITHTHTK